MAGITVMAGNFDRVGRIVVCAQRQPGVVISSNPERIVTRSIRMEVTVDPASKVVM
jgi:hypothetical protein